MNARPILWLLTLAATFAAGSSAAAQEKRLDRFGTQAFRNILGDLGLTPLSSFSALGENSAKDSVLIVLGNTERLIDGKPALEHILGGLKSFIEQGGAVLVATDEQTPVLLWLDFGVEVDGTKIRTANLEDTYCKEFPDCPMVRDFRASSELPFRGLDRKGIATNKPSFLRFEPRLRFDPRPPRSAAWFPRGCTVDGLAMPRLPFAMKEELGDGRLLVLSDHSVFINVMMHPDESDNYRFAENCISWLSNNGVRKRVLFVEEGQIQTEFNAPMMVELPPLPPPEKLLDLLQSLLAEIEPAIPLGPVLTVVAAGLTVALLGYGLARMLRAMHHVEAAVPLLASAYQAMPRLTVIELRHQEMLQTGNLWEPARDLCRHCFPMVELLAEGMPTPVLTIHGNVWQRWRIRAAVKRLWHVAYSTEPRRITPRAFARLRAQADSIKSALAAGTLAIRLPDSRIS